MAANENNFKEILEKLKCQFLSCVPLKCLNLQALENLDWNEQKELIDATVAHKLNQQLPIKLEYQVQFLKKLLEIWEKQQVEVHDEVYERFCDMQQRLTQSKTAKFSYKHYLIPKYDTHVTLRESLSFVLDGTTGLCSWQASLVLANYFLKNPHLLENKHVMELGTGTGLSGFVIMRCCGLKNLLLTDGSDKCVALLHGNMIRNFPQAVEETPGIYHINKSTLAILKLPWNSIESYKRTIAAFETEVLLAADVVYDDEIFDELLHAIDFIFKHAKKQVVLYLAATVRNPETLQKFLLALSACDFTHKLLPEIVEDECELHWDRSTPINLYEVSKSLTHVLRRLLFNFQTVANTTTTTTTQQTIVRLVPLDAYNISGRYRLLNKNGQRPTRHLPNSLIIGVKKSGTRALLEFIRLHPDVRAAGMEIHFFDRYYQRGLHWYRHHMPYTIGDQITMEKTPSYFITKEAPKRVHHMNPGIRLLVVVRDPVTRAISDYAQAASKKLDMKRFEDLAFVNGSLEVVDTNWGPVKLGVYVRYLERWLKYFPLSQMLFVSGERLISDPAYEIGRVQQFLGLKRIITEKHFYFNASKGFPCLFKSEARSTPHCLGKTKGRSHPHIASAAIERLRDFYRPFNNKFYQMTDINFAWL